MKRLPAPLIEQIISLYQSGMLPKEIGEKFGIYNNSVTRILRKLKIPRNRSAPRVSPQNIQIIIDRYATGESSESIAKDLEINGTTVCRILKRNNITIRPSTENKRKYQINKDFFKVIDTEEKAYFLGLMYADGNLHKAGHGISLRLKDNDVDILKKFSMAIYECENIVYRERMMDYGLCKMAGVHISSIEMWQDLNQLGCTPNKTFTIRLPQLPQNLYRHFIRGYFDGDGCLSFKKIEKKAIFDITSNYIFAQELAAYIKNALNITCTLHQSNRNPKTGNFQVHNYNDLYILLHYLYDDATVYLERKYQKYLEIQEIIKLKSKTGTQNLNIDQQVLEWFNYYRRVGFPYCRYNDYTIKKSWESLIKKQIEEPKEDIITIFNYLGMDLIKNFQPALYEVRTNRGRSIVEAFNDDQLLMGAIRNRLDQGFKMSDNMLIQGLRNGFFGFHTSIFQPLLAKFLYNKYCPAGGKIYDPCMGFGQRLLGALSANKEFKYVGTDPWAKVYQGNLKILAYLQEQGVSTDGCQLYNLGAEELFIDEVDCVLISPPFYNVEIYEENDVQAYHNRTYQQFLQWWQQVVNNLVKGLKSTGTLILHISDKYSDDLHGIILDSGLKLKDYYYLQLNKNNKYLHKKKNKYEHILIFGR